ncbi:FitA-like ribbon-helix-helix domain-containing protein [Synechococcus sp. OH2]|uniref:FitA-like ribbon-helix-helix domain-containing protein n=1 Tax=Synechococcus sp. OH2 TaxID=136798 RepID=UPI0039C49E7C
MNQTLHDHSNCSLIVRNVDEAIVKTLKERERRHGASAEAEHRKILEQVLLQLAKKVLCQVLRSIPNVGEDSDFERLQEDNTTYNYLLDTKVINPFKPS